MSEQNLLTPVRFSYAFAKERGLIVLDDTANPVVLGARGEKPDPWAVIVEGISTADLDLENDDNDLASLAEGLPKTADLLDSENDAPVIRLINAMIAEAVKVKASDIHIEPYEKTLSIRLRIDGVLRGSFVACSDDTSSNVSG